jgi:hypothetical protein
MSEQTHKSLPNEPTEEMVNAAYHTWKHIAHPSIMSAIRAILKAAIQAAPEVEQEPVGKIVLHDCSYIGELFNSNDNHVEGTLLYTHSQPKD